MIAHVCNDSGGWGKGFVLALSRRWPEPEAAYRAWHRGRASNDFGLGALQTVQVERDVWVANMVGQHGVRRGGNGVPVRYDAIDAALARSGPVVRITAQTRGPARTSAALSSVADAPRRRPPPPCNRAHQPPLTGIDKPRRHSARRSKRQSLAHHALDLHASVHMPRIGCGLAGGEWCRVEPLVTGRLAARGVAVTVYDHGEG